MCKWDDLASRLDIYCTVLYSAVLARVDVTAESEKEESRVVVLRS